MALRDQQREKGDAYDTESAGERPPAQSADVAVAAMAPAIAPRPVRPQAGSKPKAGPPGGEHPEQRTLYFEVPPDQRPAEELISGEEVYVAVEALQGLQMITTALADPDT